MKIYVVIFNASDYDFDLRINMCAFHSKENAEKFAEKMQDLMSRYSYSDMQGSEFVLTSYEQMLRDEFKLENQWSYCFAEPIYSVEELKLETSCHT